MIKNEVIVILYHYLGRMLWIGYQRGQLTTVERLTNLILKWYKAGRDYASVEDIVDYKTTLINDREE